jgi:hypothetical protein
LNKFIFRHTTNAYQPKQLEFISWCREHEHYRYERIPELVTGGKLLLFLNAQDGRVSRKRKRGEAEDSVIGIKTYEGYVNAMVDLWKQQEEYNRNPSPRDNYVKRFLQNKSKETAKISIQNFTDRGTGTLLDGYSTLDQLAKIIEAGWTLHNNLKGLRNGAMFALSHTLLLRGDNVRVFDFSSLFSVELENENLGGNKPFAVVGTMIKSKTNVTGRKDYSAMLRHKDVKCCAISWLALYLFAKWRNDFPSFVSRQSWYNLKVYMSIN